MSSALAEVPRPTANVRALNGKKPIVWDDENLFQQEYRRHFLRQTTRIVDKIEGFALGEVTYYELHEFVLDLQDRYLVHGYNEAGGPTDR